MLFIVDPLEFHFDPHPFARNGSMTILSISGLHIAQSGLLLYSHSTGNATCLLALLMAMKGLGVHGDGPVLSALMIFTALLAIAGTMFRLGPVRLATFIPQHVMLGIMAIGGLWAAWQGAYLDGTVVPWNHILADQGIVVAMFVAHTAAIIRRARDPNG